jgi:hypothetical protein
MHRTAVTPLTFRTSSTGQFKKRRRYLFGGWEPIYLRVLHPQACGDLHDETIELSAELTAAPETEQSEPLMDAVLQPH